MSKIFLEEMSLFDFEETTLSSGQKARRKMIVWLSLVALVTALSIYAWYA